MQIVPIDQHTEKYNDER